MSWLNDICKIQTYLDFFCARVVRELAVLAFTVLLPPLEAVLSSATSTSASLGSVSLVVSSRAVLLGAGFLGGTFSGAGFLGGTFSGAGFLGGTFSGAVFLGAGFSGAAFLGTRFLRVSLLGLSSEEVSSDIAP